MRRQIVDAFWNTTPARELSDCGISQDSHSGEQKPRDNNFEGSQAVRIRNQELLKKHLDKMLYLPEPGSGCEGSEKDLMME